MEPRTIVYIILVTLGVALAWGFLTDWTFSGLLPREGAMCTPGGDEKVENAEQHMYDGDKKCTLVQSCRTGWKPDASNTACISSIAGMPCNFKGDKADKGVYRYSSQNVCELSGCMDGLAVDNGKCVPPCEGKTLSNIRDVGRAYACGLVTKPPACYKVSGDAVIPKTSTDFTDNEVAHDCLPNDTVFIRNQQGKDRVNLPEIPRTDGEGKTLAECRDDCKDDANCIGFSYTDNNGKALSESECVLRQTGSNDQASPTESVNGFVFYRRWNPTT